MTGFFARMAALATGDVERVRLRPPQPYEGMWQDHPFEEVDVDEVFAGPSPGRVAEPAPVVRAPDAAPHDAAPVVDRKPWESDHTRTDRAAVAPERAAEFAVPAARLQHPEGTPPTSAPESPAASWLQRSEGTSTSAPELLAASRPAGSPPAVSNPDSSDRVRAREASRAPAPDVIALLREHLVPLLVARRVIEQSERIVVVERAADAPAPRCPLRPGVVEVSHTPVAPVAPNSPRTAEPPDSTPAPTVSLHIDRIVVNRGQASQRSRPAPRPAPATIDHDAYLARRRERP